jgi:membrane protein DedA with SNARE-associated domain
VPVLLAVGALAGMGKLSFAAALLLSAVASLLADSVWFQLGRRQGARILSLLCRISLEPDSCVRKTENVIAGQGARALLFAKFLPGLSTVAPPVAGLIRMRPSRFVLWDGAGALLWAGAYMGLGFVFSEQLERAAEVALGLGSRLVALIVGILAVYVLWKYVQRRRFLRQITIDRITPEELKLKLEAGENVVVMDLRHSSEFEADEASLPGALHVPPDALDAHLDGIPRDREVVLFCT